MSPATPSPHEASSARLKPPDGVVPERPQLGPPPPGRANTVSLIVVATGERRFAALTDEFSTIVFAVSSAGATSRAPPPSALVGPPPTAELPLIVVFRITTGSGA